MGWTEALRAQRDSLPLWCVSALLGVEKGADEGLEGAHGREGEPRERSEWSPLGGVGKVHFLLGLIQFIVHTLGF